MDNRIYERNKSKRKRLLVIGCVFLLLCSALSALGETVDLLEMPSKKVEWAPYGLLMDVVKENNRIFAVGERGRILYSDDECSGWIQAEVPVSVTLTMVTFPTYDQGWAIGHDGVVLHTEDGGKTWKKQIDGTQIGQLVLTQVRQMVQTHNDLFAAKEAELSENERKDMKVKSKQLNSLLRDVEFFVKEGPSQPLMDVWFKNDREGIIIGAFGFILSTNDGGKTWQPILDRIENSGKSYYAITRSGDDLFIAGEAGILYRSKDFGQNWQRLESPYTGSFFGMIGDPSGGFVAAFGMKGHIFYSQDRGETWIPSKTNREVSLFGGTFLSDGSFSVVGADGVILISNDRGKTFTALPERYRGQGIAIAELKRDVFLVAGTSGVSRIEINKTNSKK